MNLNSRDLPTGLLLAPILLLVLVSPSPPSLAAETGSGPTVEITVKALADDYADSMYPQSAYGMRAVLYVGNSYDRPQNVSGPARIYIRFDLSTVPRRAHIVSADMALYQLYGPASAQTYEVHMVQSPWNESTMDWTTQPATDSTVLSAALAPADKDVWLSWSVTSAVQAWVNEETPNYGLMIRINNERTGVANEASGFYSREYPKELTPKLRVLCQNNPPFTYLSTIHLSGLPDELSSVVTADGTMRIKVYGGGAAYFLFESGTEHMINVDEYVNASESVRYHAKIHSTVTTAETEFTVTYEPQFLISVRSEPAGLIQREWSDWYYLGTIVETPLAPEVAYDAPGIRIILDGWYINGARQPGNAINFTVDGPATVVATYGTTYNVTLSSPFGTVSGSGWHAAGTSVEISVMPTYVPAGGILGYFGLGMTFDRWTGSFESTSPTATITVNGPIQARAVWREDRSRLVLGVAVTVGLILAFVTLRARAKHRGPKGRFRNAEMRNS